MRSLQHYTGISSQITSGSAIDEQLRSYFLAIKAVEESPSPFQDGAASQTPSVESADVDASAATAGSFLFNFSFHAASVYLMISIS